MTAVTTQSGFTDDAAESHITHPERKHEKYEPLIGRAKSVPPIRTGVAWPCEVDALEGPVEAAREKGCTPCAISVSVA